MKFYILGYVVSRGLFYPVCAIGHLVICSTDKSDEFMRLDKMPSSPIQTPTCVGLITKTVMFYHLEDA